MTVWLVRAGKHGEAEQTAIEKGLVTIGWNEIPDLTPLQTREAVGDLYRSVHPEASAPKVANEVGQIWAFRSRIQPGDLVVLPLKTHSAIAVGKASGGYRMGRSTQE